MFVASVMDLGEDVTTLILIRDNIIAIVMEMLCGAIDVMELDTEGKHAVYNELILCYLIG